MVDVDESIFWQSTQQDEKEQHEGITNGCDNIWGILKDLDLLEG